MCKERESCLTLTNEVSEAGSPRIMQLTVSTTLSFAGHFGTVNIKNSFKNRTTHSNASDNLLLDDRGRIEGGLAYTGIKSTKLVCPNFVTKYSHIASQTRAICVRSSILHRNERRLRIGIPKKTRTIRKAPWNYRC